MNREVFCKCLSFHSIVDKVTKIATMDSTLMTATMDFQAFIVSHKSMLSQEQARMKYMADKGCCCFSSVFVSTT